MLDEDRLFCITVKVRPDGSQLDIVIEDDLCSSNLIEKIREGLQREYRQMRDVTDWCFHEGKTHLYPGDFKPCRVAGLEAWLQECAAEAFGWEVS